MRKLLARKIYQTREQKRNDFIIGLVGWPAGNMILWIGVQVSGSIAGMLIGELARSIAADSWIPIQAVGDILAVGNILCAALPLLINVVLLIYLGVTRRWIALGALTILGGLLLLAVCLAGIVGGICFVYLSRGGQIP